MRRYMSRYNSRKKGFFQKNQTHAELNNMQTHAKLNTLDNTQTRAAPNRLYNMQTHAELNTLDNTQTRAKLNT